MELAILLILGFVYLGMILGYIPGLSLNRAGIAAVGAILLLLCKGSPLQEATSFVDVPTLVILFGLMLVSAQFYFSGFYGLITHKLASKDFSPQSLLFFFMGASGILSAVLVNDIVCLAMTPLIIRSCHLKQLNPVPFLLGLACASNIGSALTLIGNPQNILIGQEMGLSFRGYLLDSFVPTLLGWFVAWGVIVKVTKGKWDAKKEAETRYVEYPQYDRGQSNKGIVIIAFILGFFLFSSYPREYIVLLGAAGILLSKRMHSKNLLGFIDWQLLVLFVGLFIVTHSLIQTGVVQGVLSYFETVGVSLNEPIVLFPVATFLSNIISNVPSVMLLLSFLEPDPLHGAILAIASTFAGNLFILGSIANIIVVSQSADLGVKISWKQHFRIGLPVTIFTLIIAGMWLWIRYSVF